MKPQQQSHTNPHTPHDSMNLVYVAAKGMAASVWPFFRSNIGEQALFLPGLVAFLIITIYGAAMNAPEMAGYLGSWLVVVAWKNAKARWRTRRGYVQHSLYDGWPFIAIRIPFARTEDRAKTIEPFLCFFAGVFLCPLSEPIGTFVIFGAGGLLVTRIIELRVRDTRIRRMRDTMIEMRQMNEGLRRWH